jgi:sulfate adenylyltransferase
MDTIIAPHGGRLVNRVAADAERAGLLDRARNLPGISLNARQRSDVDLMAVGALSPLEGFMVQADYQRVLQEMRLASGAVWAVPVTLDADAETAERAKTAGEAALVDESGEPVAVMKVEDVYDWDPALEARQVYRTEDDAHPGVAYLRTRAARLVGGTITLLRKSAPEFADYHLEPAETRALFAERGWRTVVAFQTRNPIHRAHEYLTKCALETVDGLLIHPLVGETKQGDIPADVRMRCYQVLIDHYYPKERTALSTLPAAMRYAGPREAIWHAILRKNYGCSHFIVGRDHAGVGSYYGTYDAQQIFDEFEPQEIGITPVKFEHTFFHTGLKEMVSGKTSPGPKEAHLFLSGTKVREMLSAGEDLPPEFTRPEVSHILKEHYQKVQVG